MRFDSAGGGCAANESTTNWVYEVIVAGTKTCFNSGLAVAANTWYHVRIYSDHAGHHSVSDQWRQFRERGGGSHGHTGAAVHQYDDRRRRGGAVRGLVGDEDAGAESDEDGSALFLAAAWFVPGGHQ